jgi:hypothetical protein
MDPNDKESVLEAVNASGGHVLKFASPKLKKDKDVVMAAVTNSSTALAYASP